MSQLCGDGAVRAVRTRVEAAMAALLWIGVATVVGATLGAPPARAMNNDGGVLLLHYESIGDFEGGNFCELFTLKDPRSPTVRVPADGRQHLIMAYASYPPDSVGWVAGVTFGIEYSPSVVVHSHGACNRNGLVVPEHGFPKSPSGVAVVNSPVSLGNIIPIYWFLVSSKGPGTFELTPHPNPNHGGSFGTGEKVPTVSPICGYGKIGFDLEGSFPVAGEVQEMGGCCLERCYELSPADCDWFGGTYLGSEADCQTLPCGDQARTGACCVGGGCEIYTALECTQLGGRFLGEGTECTDDACDGDAPVMDEK